MEISIQANCYWVATSTILGTWKFPHRQTAFFLACGNFHTGKLLLGTSPFWAHENFHTGKLLLGSYVYDFGYMEIFTQANCYFFGVWKFPYRQTAIGYIYNFGRMEISIQANFYWVASYTSTILGAWKFPHRQTAILKKFFGVWKFPYRQTAIGYIY